MKHSVIIKSGIAGTVWMSFYMSLASLLFKKEMNIVKTLRSLSVITLKKRSYKISKCKANLASTIIHYGNGVLFSYLYYILWKNKTLIPGKTAGVALGALNGLIGMAGWKPFIALHPALSKILNKKFMLNLTVAHILFGLATTLSYKKIQK